MAVSELLDPFNRNLNYLRISVTDRCNLNCVYCNPNKLSPKLTHEDILTYEEILRIVETGVNLGIKKVRVTGGEPLTKKNIYVFLKKLATIQGLEDISLTTNGIFLKPNLAKIKDAGVKRINISLDTLDRQKFQYISGFDKFNVVWEGIEQAHKIGLAPIKLNVVALKNINDDEFIDLAKLSITYPFHIRFIEYMPIGNSKIKPENQILASEIKKKICELGELKAIANTGLDGPAERYKFKGARGEIGFIQPISKHFCKQCNRLRLTASGKLRSCLLSNHQVDIKTPLRSGCSDQELHNIFLETIRYKQLEHQLNGKQKENLSPDQMSSIGG